MEDNLKRQLCNELIRQGKVKEGDVIRHSYTNSRFNSFHIENKDNHDCCSTITTRADCIGVVENKPCPTLDTRCDCLGVVVDDRDIDNPLKGKTPYGWHFEQNVYSEDTKCCRSVKAGEGSGNMLKVIESEPKINVVGNYKPSGHSCGRVITSDGITPTVMENHGAVQAIVDKENVMDNQMPNYRIRKLTPKECFRLMGIKDKDFEKIQPNQSNASLYHLAGDSIVTTCMMGIFGELFNVPDYRDKIENLLEGLN